MRTIAFASDHGGFELKNHIMTFLEGKGYACVDYGCFDAESCDYPDYAKPACKAVLEGQADCALLFCGTGVGMSIAANKIKGIRACNCSDVFSAEMTRAHNAANVLCMGGRVVGHGLAEKLVEAFISTDFMDGGKHLRRVNKIAELEQE